MSTEMEEPAKETVTSLVGDILVDLRDLVEQQFRLTRREIEDALRALAAAAVVFALGVGVLFLGALVLSLSLVQLLHWASSPPGSDPAWFPMWACHAVVAAMLAVVGGVLTHLGRAKYRSIEPIPNPATEIMQEHSHE